MCDSSREGAGHLFLPLRPQIKPACKNRPSVLGDDDRNAVWQKTELRGPRDGLHGVAAIEFFAGAGEMELNGLLAYPEGARDLLRLEFPPRPA